MKEKAKICRNCEYSEPTKRNSKVIYYCNKHYSRRTHNGKLKIKAGDVACYCYKEYLGGEHCNTYQRQRIDNECTME